MNRLFKQIGSFILMACIVGAPAFAGPDVQALRKQESRAINKAQDRTEISQCKITKLDHLRSKGLQALTTVNCAEAAVVSCKDRDHSGYRPIGQTKGQPMGRQKYC